MESVVTSIVSTWGLTKFTFAQIDVSSFRVYFIVIVGILSKFCFVLLHLIVINHRLYNCCNHDRSMEYGSLNCNLILMLMKNHSGAEVDELMNN